MFTTIINGKAETIKEYIKREKGGVESGKLLKREMDTPSQGSPQHEICWYLTLSMGPPLRLETGSPEVPTQSGGGKQRQLRGRG